MLVSDLQPISQVRVLKWMTFHRSRPTSRFQLLFVLESKARSDKCKSVGGVYRGKRLLRGHSSRRRNNRLVYLSDFSRTLGEWKLTHHGVSGKVGIEHSQGLQSDQFNARRYLRGISSSSDGNLQSQIDK